MAHSWQLGFQSPASEIMDSIISFHDYILAISFAIVLGVFALLVYVMVRFNAKKNKDPSTYSHNTTLEIVWIVGAFLIVLSICFPTIKLLRKEEIIPHSDMTIKVVGHQWYWTYSYPDNNSVTFDSNIKYDLKPGEYRLLEVDNKLVLPINTNIRILITASDVIHSWAVPALGLKKDAVPGRLNELWVNISKPGVYYGQCSELCGGLHGFMPIAVKAVEKEEFDVWIKEAKKIFA